MNRKQFFLLSLLVCTLIPQADLHASKSSKVFKFVAQGTGLVAGTFGIYIALRGYQLTNLPEAEKPLGNPYMHAMFELPEVLAQDYDYAHAAVKKGIEKVKTASAHILEKMKPTVTVTKPAPTTSDDAAILENATETTTKE